MDNSQIIVGVPILLMVAMLLLLGATWLMRHHRLRPFAGIVLFALGVAFFWRVALIPQPDAARRSAIRAPAASTAGSATGSFAANAERNSADDGALASEPSDALPPSIPDPDVVGHRAASRLGRSPAPFRGARRRLAGVCHDGRLGTLFHAGGVRAGDRPGRECRRGPLYRPIHAGEHGRTGPTRRRGDFRATS